MKNANVIHYQFHANGTAADLRDKQRQARDFLSANRKPPSPLVQAMANIGIECRPRPRVVYNKDRSEADQARAEEVRLEQEYLDHKCAQMNAELAERDRNPPVKKPGERWYPPETKYVKRKGQWVQIVEPGGFY